MKFIVVFITLLIGFNAHANLLISPTRLNFDSRDRVHEVMLINTTSEARTYRISWSEKKMGLDGKYEELIEGDNSVARLSPYMRFSPRQVRLASGERQTIKLQLRKKANMSESEYRSHLLFTAMPPESELDAQEELVEGMRMQLNMLVSYSIPVMYYPVKPSATVNVQSYNLIPRVDNGADLKIVMRKTGENTTFGRLEVYATADGKEQRIGLSNGVSFYKEADTKEQRVLIPKYKDYNAISNVRVKYIGEKEYAGQILVEQSISL